MELKDKLFLEALKASLKNEKVSWEMELTDQDLLELFKTAEKHHVLPMIYEAVYSCPAVKRIDPQVLQPYKRWTMQCVMLQILKTNEFLQLCSHLSSKGIHPLVVKGIVCRNLYPKSDYRMSGDEDILIPAGEFMVCHEAMLEYGMQTADENSDLEADYEIPHNKQNSPIYIELHKTLFLPTSDAYGDLKRYFEHIQDQAIKVSADGKELLTMGYTDHLFYLICHSFKHFLHSGFGIRQVCDITLFANVYGKEIDWLKVLKQCWEIRADLFAAALFKIGQKYLTFDPEIADYPAEWSGIAVDETLMLNDLLDVGVYGSGTMSRKHSSNITLNAVSVQKQGCKAGNGVIKTIFPSAKNLQGRYVYLKKHPYLLPIAWANRIWTYRKELSRTENNDAAKAVKIGNQRVELLKKYNII